MDNARAIITSLDMQPHPEGGWWKPYYLSEEKVWVARLQGYRQCGSSITYLLEKGDFSAVHVLRADEIWLYQGGDPMRLMWIDLHGQLQEVQLGPAGMAGTILQIVVPHGSYMAAESTGMWSIVGCAMAPAFHEDDFVLCRREDLLQAFPHHHEWITAYTRG